jgi:hypothetical protein
MLFSLQKASEYPVPAEKESQPTETPFDRSAGTEADLYQRQAIAHTGTASALLPNELFERSSLRMFVGA